MPVAKSHGTPEEIARLGVDMYDRHVRPALRPEDDGRFVAVDVGTGDYVIDENDYKAVMRLRDRKLATQRLQLTVWRRGIADLLHTLSLGDAGQIPSLPARSKGTINLAESLPREQAGHLEPHIQHSANPLFPVFSFR